MFRSIPLGGAALLIGVLAIPGGGAAQDPKKDALVSDPAVTSTLQKGETPPGKRPPDVLPAESSPDLQRAMDRAHQGSTGTTREPGATRRPEGQPPDIADAPSGAPNQLGPTVPPPP